MGIQICIERQDLEAAGWNCHVESEFYPDPYSKEDNPPLFEHKFLVIEKDEWCFVSYCEGCFYADANHWGYNRKKFIAAGLYDLPYSEG